MSALDELRRLHRRCGRNCLCCRALNEVETVAKDAINAIRVVGAPNAAAYMLRSLVTATAPKEDR